MLARHITGLSSMTASNQSTEAKPSWLLKTLSVVLGVLGFLFIALGLYFLVQGNSMAAATGVGCGVVLLLLATVDRFEVIKGIGIEAKTRDLSRKIDDAEEILARIKEITVAFTPSLVSLAANAGRLSGVQPPELVYGLVRASDRLLTAARESRVAVRSALAPWVKLAAIDLTRDVLSPLREDANREEMERQRKVRQWPSPIPAGDTGHSEAVRQVHAVGEWTATWNNASQWSAERCAIELRRIASSIPEFIDPKVALAFQQDVELWAPEIDYLAEHADFREPGVWLQRLRKIYSPAS